MSERRTSVGAESTYSSHPIRDFNQQPQQQCHRRANQENREREQPDHKQQHQRIVEQSQGLVERSPCVEAFSPSADTRLVRGGVPRPASTAVTYAATATL